MSAVDMDVLNQLAADLAPEDLHSVLRSFDVDMQRAAAALAAAAGAGDANGFRRAAHVIAGAAGSVGAVVLERAARNAMARTELSAAAAEEAAHIAALAEAAVAELRSFVISAETGK